MKQNIRTLVFVIFSIFILFVYPTLTTAYSTTVQSLNIFIAFSGMFIIGVYISNLRNCITSHAQTKKSLIEEFGVYKNLIEEFENEFNENKHFKKIQNELENVNLEYLIPFDDESFLKNKEKIEKAIIIFDKYQELLFEIEDDLIEKYKSKQNEIHEGVERINSHYSTSLCEKYVKKD